MLADCVLVLVFSEFGRRDRLSKDRPQHPRTSAKPGSNPTPPTRLRVAQAIRPIQTKRPRRLIESAGLNWYIEICGRGLAPYKSSGFRRSCTVQDRRGCPAQRPGETRRIESRVTIETDDLSYAFDLVSVQRKPSIKTPPQFTRQPLAFRMVVISGSAAI